MLKRECPLAKKEYSHDFCKFDKSVSCERTERYQECPIYDQALCASHGTEVRELETLVVGD